MIFKEDNEPERSKLEKTEKAHTPKNAKNLGSFLGFPNFVKRFIPNYRNYGTPKYTHTSLNRTLTKRR